MIQRLTMIDFRAGTELMDFVLNEEDLPYEEEFLEVEPTFRVTGRGRIGADGLAFWYTAARGSRELCMAPMTSGLVSVCFLTPSTTTTSTITPYISAMNNDGTNT